MRTGTWAWGQAGSGGPSPPGWGGRRGHWLHSRLPPLGPGKQEAVSHLGEGRAQPRESASPSGSPVPWQQGLAYVTDATSPQPHLYSGDKSASAVICSEDKSGDVQPTRLAQRTINGAVIVTHPESAFSRSSCCSLTTLGPLKRLNLGTCSSFCLESLHQPTLLTLLSNSRNSAYSPTLSSRVTSSLKPSRIPRSGLPHRALTVGESHSPRL